MSPSPAVSIVLVAMPPDSSAADRNGFGASMSGSAAVPLFGPGPVQSTSTALPPFDQQQLQLYGQSLHQDQQPQHSSQHSHQQQPQRKRKSSSGGKGTPSGDKRARQGSSAGEDDDDKVKRAKTPRACDQVSAASSFAAHVSRLYRSAPPVPTQESQVSEHASDRTRTVR